METAPSILTHGLELADQLLLGPLGPLLLVRVDGAQDGTTRFPAILDGRNVQVMDEHDVGVLWGKTGRTRSQPRVLSDGRSGTQVVGAENRGSGRKTPRTNAGNQRRAFRESGSRTHTGSETVSLIT